MVYNSVGLAVFTPQGDSHSETNRSCFQDKVGEEKKAVNSHKKNKGLVEFLGGPFFKNFFCHFIMFCLIQTTGIA